MTGIVRQSSEHIYRGLWRVLADVFRVPREPPDLPASSGETILRFKPSDGWLRYLKTLFWIVLLIIDIALTAGYVAIAIACILSDLWWVALLLLPVALIIIVVPDIFAYVAIHLKYDTTWYIMSDRSMRIRRGIWSIHETTITYENVQNVKVRQGPLQRHFGVANVIVETAGGGGAAAGGSHGGRMGAHTGIIEGVSNAQELRDRILARLRRSKSAGLGDDASDDPAALEGSPSSFGSAHIAALRDIRDELRAFRTT